MRKIFFVVLCLCAWDTAVYAAACGEIEEGCAAGQYCTETGGSVTGWTCTSCPEGFPHSDAGSVDIKACYKICGEDGGWPDSGDFDTENGQLQLTGDKEIHYISENQTGLCLYDLVCNDEHDKCGGYHLAVDKLSCQPNKQECTGENGRGIQVWNWNEGEYSDCYITSCNEGCVLGPTESGGLELPQICGQEYGACECEGDYSDACQRWLSGCNGQILSDGETKWDYEKAWWNFENCYCKTKGAIVDGGKGTTTCFYARSDKYGGNTEWSTDCEVIVSSCNSGYCVQGVDFSKCVQAPLGYYAAADNLACQACPDAGTTTQVEGAESAGECVMVRGERGTRFCDSQGCFYLPGTGFIQKAN